MEKPSQAAAKTFIPFEQALFAQDRMNQQTGGNQNAQQMQFTVGAAGRGSFNIPSQNGANQNSADQQMVPTVVVPHVGGHASQNINAGNNQQVPQQTGPGGPGASNSSAMAVNNKMGRDSNVSHGNVSIQQQMQNQLKQLVFLQN